ncbi:MAG: isoprenylcysteine carboxylmethyltransferase family protein [archaeon]|nr:isoprenylcysteine carboxylmethyltransferase family protein [archaeon]
MTQETPHSIDKNDIPFPNWIFVFMPFYIIFLFGILIFPIAQDFFWIEAWLFITTFAFNMAICYFFINKKNPRVIRNRSKIKKVGIKENTKKSAGSDKYIFPFISIGFILTFILPSIDHNNPLTSIHPLIEVLGLIVSNIGLLTSNVAQLQNAYASKLLDINKDQKLIDTGLYSRVRHPLYSGVILWILGIPIALGSLISLIPATITIFGLIVRIKFEEEMLINGMEGYEEYRTHVKYKILPKIY